MKRQLREIFEGAVDAVAPARCLPPFVPSPCAGRTWLAGAGKAAAAMADTFVKHYRAEVTGAVVTRYGHGLPDNRRINGVDVLEAGHPLPDAASFVAGARMLELAARAAADDRLVFLLSGGASALMEHPAAGFSQAQIIGLNRELLSSGATIAQINARRRTMSALKGGGLAAAAVPAESIVLAISDVPGDHFADIGSGPFSLPDDDPRMRHVRTRIIATADDALKAAADAAASRGFTPVMLGTAIDSSAHALAREHARLALEYAQRPGRHALLSGGETSVATGRGAGRGGRNSEYLLALVIALQGAGRIHALAADTDGIDGNQPAAGAVCAPDTLARADSLGIVAEDYLRRQDSYEFFAALDDAVVTGPTRTNVNDVRIILVG